MLDEILKLMRFYKNYKTLINGMIPTDDDFMAFLVGVYQKKVEYTTFCDGYIFEINANY